jgi:hypothetical protein
MQYRTPQLITLPPAINAIQGTPKTPLGVLESATSVFKETLGGYEDWESGALCATGAPRA